MKDPSWQKSEDYGKRIDYCAASTETMLGMLDHKRIPKQYWAQPKKGSWNKHNEGIFRTRAQAPLLIGSEIFEKWNGVFKALQTQLGNEEVRNHSLGMFALTMTAELVKPEVIWLIGFDNLLNPMRLDYWKANRGKWVSGHDWRAENAMLPIVERECNVDISAWA